MSEAIATVVEDDDEHADFSPSGFKRKALCPASHIAEKKYPNVSSAAAIDGTHTHKLVEVCVVHNKKNANEYIGKKLIDHEGEFEIDKARAERANMALNYIDNQVTASAYPVQVAPEGRVNPGSLIFRDDWYGTADVIMLFGDITTPDSWINVIDYKDGAQPVDPFENYQGIGYMLGVIAKVNPPMDTPIVFTIIQPKSGGIKEWHTTVSELLTVWLTKCQEIITRCEQPDAPFCAGEEQCQYCLHRKNCEARQASAVTGINSAMAGIDIDSAETTVIENPTLAPSLPVIGEMPNETLSKVMLLAPIIRGWLKDIDEEALDRVKKGGVIPEFKMVQKNGRRSWESEHAPILKSLLSMTANKERIFKKADIVEEKLVSFTTILNNPNLSSSQKTRIEKEFIKHPQGQKALVLKTEKGKDISPAAQLNDMPVVEMQTSNQ